MTGPYPTAIVLTKDGLRSVFSRLQQHDGQPWNAIMINLRSTHDKVTSGV